MASLLIMEITAGGKLQQVLPYGRKVLPFTMTAILTDVAVCSLYVFSILFNRDAGEH